MRPGEYRYLITIEYPEKTRNRYGEEIEEWKPFKQVWASIETLKGGEFWAARQVLSEINVKIKIRYQEGEGITREMRITYGERIFHIESILPDEKRQKELHLMCRERI